jgi:hypothetical protein
MRPLAGCILVAALTTLAVPALSQTTVQFCRDVRPGPVCVGATTVFSTTDPFFAFIVVIPQRGPYEIRVEFVNPTGAVDVLVHRTQRTDANQTFGFRVPIFGEKAETLPGEWTVRVLVGEVLIATGKFTLQLFGEPKVWVPPLKGVSVVRAVTARRIESNEPLDEGTEFRLGDSVFAYVRFSHPPSQPGAVASVRWNWIAPSGESLERAGEYRPREGSTGGLAWSRIPTYDGRVQQPTGEWKVEFNLAGVVVARLTFNLLP